MKNSMNLPLKSMPADSLSSIDDSLSSIDDSDVFARNRALLRVADAADIVSSKLTVLCALIDSDKYEELDDNDRYCAQRLIYDTLQECIALLRDSESEEV